MKVNKNTLEAYDFLKRLYQESEKTDSPNILFHYNDIQIYGDIEKTDKYHWFPEAPKTLVDKYISSLYLFGSDGGGGEFLLWSYPNINKEPAAIFVDSEVGIAYLAPSLSDYVLNFPPNDIGFDRDDPFRKKSYPNLRKRLTALEEKLEQAECPFFDKSLHSLNSRYDEYKQLIYELEDADEFWVHIWSLDSLSQIHEKLHDDFNVNITLREAIQKVTAWMSLNASEAEKHFQATPESEALSEKMYFDNMVQDIYCLD